MDESVPTDRLAAVAERAVHAGGEYLADAFRNGAVDAEYGVDDVSTAADRVADRRVRAEIESAFPDHAIYTEETGRHEGSGYEWVVDPLDGTNNFASDIPTFATAVAAVRTGGDEDRPLVGAVHEPVVGATYLARRGEGATVDGERLTADSDVPLERGTVALSVGLPAVRDPERRRDAERIEGALRGGARRVVESWAPLVDWGLLARGGIEGLVYLAPQRHELVAGGLLAAESGAAEFRDDGLYLAATDAATLSELRTLVGGVELSRPSRDV
ncbi:MAG: inositol monophosphatase [Haloplanus sp.]